MPREFNELVRRSGFVNAEKFYILAYEGTVTEKKYFEDPRNSDLFNDSGSIETIPLKRGTREGSNPLAVKALLSKAKQDYNFKSTDEFWLVIDRDDWETIHNIDLEKLAEDCNSEKNFFMALSNPCFEMWLILHLKKLEEIPEEDRAKIYENAAISAKKHYVDEALANYIGDGRGYNKRPNPAVFLPKVMQAIQNAKKIAVMEEPYPKTLGSDVYKLVQKLIKTDL